MPLANMLNSYYNSITIPKMIRTYNAYKMSDIYDIINDIGTNVYKYSGKKLGRPIWFRGQSYEKPLVPSLFRNRDNNINTNQSYSTVSLAEEYRHQNFASRVNHLTGNYKKSRIEWQELFQHHFGKTRFMDWSESIRTAINFALEPFIDTKDTEDNKILRSSSTPIVWVLDPYNLNLALYDFFAEKTEAIELIKYALLNLFDNSKATYLSKELQNELNNRKDIYFNMDNNNIIDMAINGLISVCVLDDNYHYNIVQMERLIERHEFNPFFYLLVRYYADALPVKVDLNMNLIPPLASIQPYHSERIRTQRGTFTIFPNYYRTPAANQFANTKLDVISIESQKNIAHCFCNIRLCDPARIVSDLIYAGERRPELYPDIQIYADYLETQQFYI